MQQRAHARAQLDTLQGYERDYQRRAQTTLSQGCDIAVQNNLRAFVDKLGRAVAQQQAELQRREQVVTAADAEFAQAQRKLKSLEALQTRRIEGERLAGARRDQKTMDELARGALRASPLAPAGW